MLFGILIFIYGCRNSKTIHFDFDTYHLEYEYEDILTDLYSIERNITISSNRTNQKLIITLLPDIEKMNDAKFFYTDSIELDGKKYGKVLIINDPFAFALIDLNTFKEIYNSHGLDDIDERINHLSEEICIGKVKNFKYSPGECKRDF